MRKLTLSLALSAAVALAALAPGAASAQNYYAPAYYGPSPYANRTNNTFSHYAVSPVVNPGYFVPGYYPPSGTMYYAQPNPAYNFTPVYSGPQYFQGYAPNRYWIYPPR